MGTPDFAVPPLRAIYEDGHEVLAVVTQPDKPKGRKGELSMPSVKEAAIALGLRVLQPEKAADLEFIAKIEELSPDVIVVAAYGQILKPSLLAVPRFGCVNIHASLLPRWRGASPIAMAIMEGDEETGVTTMLMAEGVDTGDILLKKNLKIDEHDTTGSLTMKLSELGGELIKETLRLLSEGDITPISQDSLGIAPSYAPILKKEDGLLDFSRPARELERKIRGLSPWPSAFTRLEGKLFKIYEAKAEDEPYEIDGSVSTVGAAGLRGEGKSLKTSESLKEGMIFANNSNLYISCKEGFLRLVTVQLEGKKRMSAEAFLRGDQKLLSEKLSLG